MHPHLRDQSLIETVIGAGILDADLQNIVDVTRQPVRLLYLGAIL